MLTLRRDPNGHNLYGMDLDEEVFKIAGYVWDTDLLEWVRMQQPTIHADDITVSMDDVEALLAKDYWHDQRLAYDVSENLEYFGRNITKGEAQTATTWYIFKYIYDVNDNMERIEGPLIGSWTGRAGLPW